MIKTVYMTRRLILRTIVACVGIIGLAGFRPALARMQNDNTEALKLLATLRDLDSAKILGREYLQITPEEANINLLVKLISTSQHLMTIDIDSTSTIKLRKEITQQLQKDFELNEIINLQGWILAKTEVRLCALSALLV